MGNLVLEIGKRYRTKNGRIVEIIKGNPPIDGKREGWNAIYLLLYLVSKILYR